MDGISGQEDYGFVGGHLDAGTSICQHRMCEPPRKHNRMTANNLRYRLLWWGRNGQVGQDDFFGGEVLQPYVIHDDRVAYLDISGVFGRKQQEDKNQHWLYSFGSGYRIIRNNKIFGFYLFANHGETQHNHKWWVLSPGFEMKSEIWDAGLSGHVPLGNKKLVTEGWADELGERTEFYHTGHSTFSNRCRIIENLGTGIEALVGRRLWRQSLWLYLGSEYYHVPDGKDIAGANVKVQWQASKNLQFIIADRYDNQNHNIFNVGVSVSLFPQDSSDLQYRLFEPIGPFYNGIRAKKIIQDEGLQSNPEYVNQMFFIPAANANLGVQGYGTFENPYIGFTQANINDAQAKWPDPANPERLLLTSALGAYTPGAIQLYQRQQVYGHQQGLNAKGIWDNFAIPATGTNRPLIDGAIKLAGNNIIDSIRLQNTGQFQYNNEAFGVLLGTTSIDNIPLVTLNNVDINVNNASAPTVAAIDGVLMGNNSQLAVISSTITAITTTSTPSGTNPRGNAIGIHATGDSSNVLTLPQSLISIKDSTITADSNASTADPNDFSNNGLGILVGNIKAEDINTGANTNIAVSNNKIVVNNSTITGIGKNNAYGVLVGNISALADSSKPAGGFAGNATIAVSNNSIDVTNGSNINVSSSNYQCGLMIGNKYAMADAHAGSTGVSSTSTGGTVKIEVIANTMSISGSSVNKLGIGSAVYGALIGNVDAIVDASGETMPSTNPGIGGNAGYIITNNFISSGDAFFIAGNKIIGNVIPNIPDVHGTTIDGIDITDISGNHNN